MPNKNEIQIREISRSRHSPVNAPVPYTYISKSFNYNFPEQSLITGLGLNGISDQNANITVAISVKHESVETFKKHLEEKAFKHELILNKFCIKFQAIKHTPDEQNRLWKLLQTANQLAPIPSNIFENIADNLKITPPSIPSLVSLCIKTIDGNPELSHTAQGEGKLPEELANSLTPPEKQHGFPASFENKYRNKIEQNQNNVFTFCL